MRALPSIGLSLLTAVGPLAIPVGEASAQLRGLGRRAQEALERKTEQRVNQKIEEMATKVVDGSFDAIFGAAAGMADAAAGGGAGGTAGPGGGIFAPSPSAPLEDRYAFDLVITFDLESRERGRAPYQAAMHSHFSRSAPYTGTRLVPKDRREEAEAFVILDAKNESMVMLMTTKDGKFRSAYGWSQAEVWRSHQEDTAPDTTRWQRIGTRAILGYEATGYRGTNEDGTLEFWISAEPKLAAGRMLGANASMKQLGAFPTDHPAGTLLEMTVDASDGGRMTMRATKVDVDARVTLEVADYPTIGAKR